MTTNTEPHTPDTLRALIHQAMRDALTYVTDVTTDRATYGDDTGDYVNAAVDVITFANACLNLNNDMTDADLLALFDRIARSTYDEIADASDLPEGLIGCLYADFHSPLFDLFPEFDD